MQVSKTGSRNVLLTMVLAFLLLCSMVASSLILAVKLRENGQRTAELQSYGRAINEVIGNVRDAETGQRGYLLTGNEAYLKPYTVASNGMTPALDSIRTAERAVGRNVSAHLNAIVTAKMDELQRAIALERNGRHDDAIGLVRTDRGRILMDQAKTLLLNERQFTRDRTAQISDRSTRFVQRLTVGLVAGLIAIVLLTWAMIRQQRSQYDEVDKARGDAEFALTALRAESVAREASENQVRQMQKMEAVGQLTGGIAHDFNNMLAVVMGGLELAKRRLRDDPARAETYIDNAREGATRAAVLTARLLAFSRNQPLAPKPTDLNKLVGGMSDLLVRTLGENMSVQTVLGAGLWRCYADGGEIENALLNLAVNARDAMPQGGKLTIETANAHIDDAYARSRAEVEAGQYVAVCVSDTGGGMRQEVIDQAFDPFFTTKDVGKGTGLGLSQVFGFAKQSGGHVAIYSEVGEGTTVKLYLPRYLGADVAESQIADAEPAPKGELSEIILVVEDEQRVRHFATDVLRELGYSPLSAGSPAEALRLLNENPQICVLFTDIVMPDMNGRKLADLALQTRPDLKILYTTGYTRNAVVHNGMLDVGVSFLAKPYTMIDLARKVRDVIDGRGVNRPV